MFQNVALLLQYDTYMTIIQVTNIDNLLRQYVKRKLILFASFSALTLASTGCDSTIVMDEDRQSAMIASQAGADENTGTASSQLRTPTTEYIKTADLSDTVPMNPNVQIISDSSSGPDLSKDEPEPVNSVDPPSKGSVPEAPIGDADDITDGDVYVDIDGSDTASGRQDAPFQTLTRAFRDLSPGDTVTVLSVPTDTVIDYDATYFSSGTADKPITIQGVAGATVQGLYIKADYVRVIGLNVVGPGSCADPKPRTSIRYLGKGGVIRGNTIKKTCSCAIELVSLDWKNRDSTDTTFALVEDNTISETLQCGIMITGRNHIVRNNDLSHAVQRQKVSDDSNIANLRDTDGIRFFGNDHIISGNQLHDYTYDELNINAHIDCFQSWGPANRVTIDGNTCIANTDSYGNTAIDLSSLSANAQSKLLGAHAKGVQLSAEDNAAGRDNVVTDNIVISNNIFDSTRGITTSELYNGGNVTIAHNLFYTTPSSAESGNTSGAIDIANSNTATHFIANNIIVNHARAYRVPSQNRSPTHSITIQSNLVHRDPGINDEDNVSVNDITSVDPNLTDTANGDYTPRSAMPEGINLDEKNINTYIPTSSTALTRTLFSIGPFPETS